MPIEIQAPRLATKVAPRTVFAQHFKSLGALPIKGGWGYSLEDAVVIDKGDPVVPRGVPFNGMSVEYAFVEKRIYEELIIFRDEHDRYSGIKWKQLKQSLIIHDDRKFDHLTYEVTALPDRDWNALKAEWEGPNGYMTSNFDQEAHMAKHNAKTVCYTTEYWFDITSFFGINDWDMNEEAE